MPARQSDMKKHHGKADPDTPLNDADFERGVTAMLTRKARAATGLSQTAFAKRYGIPVASLRDWEQGRRMPDNATQSYLRVIRQMPDAVADALTHAA